MITLLHGDHTEASRNELTRLRQAAKHLEVRVLDGRTLEDGLLIQALESSSLFGGEILVIIEQLFRTLGRQQKRIQRLCTILASTAPGTNVIVWEDKEVGATVVKALGPGARIQVFKLPVLIFQFLDAIHPDSAKAILPIFERLVTTEAPELIFSMMIKRVRQLLQLAGCTPPPGLAGWQLSRLTTQAKSFTMEKLVEMYSELGEIEWKLKSGQSAFSLKAMVEQFLMKL